VKTIAITRRDGGVSVMRITAEALLAPIDLREAERIAAAQLADHRAKAAAAPLGDATTVADALVVIAEVAARHAAEAVAAATPDPEEVIAREVHRFDLSKRGVDEDGQPIGEPWVVEWREIDEAEIAGLDRTYRNAWQDDLGIKVDMARAREIHRDLLRAERAPQMAALDVQVLRALEIEDDGARATALRAVAQQKQRLRDVTAAAEIAGAASVEALKELSLARLTAEKAK